MFVMYADGNGNVTVSPRLGQGHVEPQYNPSADVTLLEGSGIRDGRMTANIRCSSCDTWRGGSMDFSSSSSDWIFAYRPGESLDSTSLATNIEFHQGYGTWTWDIASARGGNSSNPFIDGTSRIPSATPPSATIESDGSTSDTMVLAHGIMASMVFLALFPAGAIFIRIPMLSRFIWIHAGLQIFAYCAFVAAAGLGIYLNASIGESSGHHQIIGIVLLAVLFVQPIAGLLHHRFFKKQQRRSFITYAHIWLGRIAIVMGMLNGGFGLMLAGLTDMGYLAAYSVVAGVVGTVYVATIIYGETIRKKQPHSAVSTVGQKHQNNVVEGEAIQLH